MSSEEKKGHDDPPAKHARDPLGARAIDSEAARPRTNLKPENELQDVQPLVVPQPTTQSKAGSAILSIVRPPYGVFSVAFNGVSTFIPSFRSYDVYSSIFVMRLSKLRGYNKTGHQYFTPVLRLYLMMLAWMRLAYLTIQAQQADDALETLFQRITKAYPLGSWAVPEPFIPFIESLIAFMPSDPRFNLVTPILPSNPGATAARSGMLADEYIPLLPSFVSMMKIIKRIGLQHNGNTPPLLNDINDTAAHIAVIAAHNAAGGNSCKMIAPGIRQAPGDPMRNEPQRDAAYRSYTDNDIDALIPTYGAAAGVQANANVAGWAEILGLDQNLNILRFIFSQSVILTAPFQQNATLADFAATGGAYASVVSVYTNNGVAYANNTVSRAAATGYPPLSARYKLYEPMLNSVLGAKLNTGLTDDQVQTAILAQWNVRYPANFSPNSGRIGDHGQNGTWNGPYFAPANLNLKGNANRTDPEALMNTVLTEFMNGRRFDKR